MADIYSSTTTTARGEGQREETLSRQTTTSRRVTSPGLSVTEETTGLQVSETVETPGKVTSVSTENRPEIRRVEQQPAVVSRSISPAVVIKKIAGAQTTVSRQADDYGIVLTFKIRIREFLSS